MYYIHLTQPQHDIGNNAGPSGAGMSLAEASIKFMESLRIVCEESENAMLDALVTLGEAADDFIQKDEQIGIGKFIDMDTDQNFIITITELDDEDSEYIVGGTDEETV